MTTAPKTEYANKLRAIAQNDYMVDTAFTNTGHDLNDIADHLDRLEMIHAQAMATIRKFKAERDDTGR